ncbi:prophage antirepressor-like protein [Neisseria sp. HSC-16F19]|nr:BRO family protein [Neisseria sp. HSC-16F19]MCP2041909.1 prophage antirepressor-like protein [Neisseria sp. HSC-16F19]
MQNSISIFQFQAAQTVRVEIKNGEPWFCLKDVAEILEIRDTKSTNFSLKENGIAKISLQTGGGKQQLTFINEPNLYRVIFRSNKAEAVKFQDWIFEEVIPQIRQTGSYAMQQLTPSQKQCIRQTVDERVHRTGETHQTVYRKLHAFCKVNSYHHIKPEDYSAALQFLDSAENTPALWQGFGQGGVMMDDETLYQLSVLTRYALDMSRLYQHLTPALRHIGSSYTGEAGSWAEVPRYWIGKMQRFLIEARPHMRQPEHIAGLEKSLAKMN